jgi:hypothetical protein
VKFREFLEALGQIKEIRSFVQDEMANLLITLGDLHYKTAITFLQRSKSSSDPEGEKRSAITALGTAYEHFRAVAYEMSLIRTARYLLPVIGNTVVYEQLHASRRASECALLMAALYNDKRDKNSMEECLSKAQRCFSTYCFKKKDLMSVYDSAFQDAVFVHRGLIQFLIHLDG